MKVIRNLVFIPFGLIIGLTVDGFEQPRHAGITMAASTPSWGVNAPQLIIGRSCGERR